MIDDWFSSPLGSSLFSRFEAINSRFPTSRTSFENQTMVWLRHNASIASRVIAHASYSLIFTLEDVEPEGIVSRRRVRLSRVVTGMYLDEGCIVVLNCSPGRQASINMMYELATNMMFGWWLLFEGSMTMREAPRLCLACLHLLTHSRNGMNFPLILSLVTSWGNTETQLALLIPSFSGRCITF